MQVTFTNDQYKNLIKLAYLGEWMVNSVRFEDTLSEFDELFSYILSFAKDAGCPQDVQYDEEMKKYLPSEKFEDEVQPYVTGYNDETFWEELVRRLAERDLVRQYGSAEVEKLDFEERMEKERPFLEKYYGEFEKTGVDRLEIT